MMDIAAIMAKVDHTLLKPEATWADIQKICDEAMEYHTASVCINPCFVKQAAEYMKGAVPVCTVIGFPLGATDTATKVFEAKTAIENGASEVDMVINIGRLKAGDVAYVTEEIAAIKKAVGDHVLKVIIETCLLTDAEKETMCQAVVDAGADFIKTSTGFPPPGPPLRTSSCSPAAARAAARSRPRAASPPWTTRCASSSWAPTVWAPAAW